MKNTQNSWIECTGCHKLNLAGETEAHTEDCPMINRHHRHPTGSDVLQALVVVAGPTVFGVACAAGYKPDLSVIGIVLALLGVTIGLIWMNTSELKWRARNEWKP